MSVKQAGMALPYPTKTDTENWTASCVITVHLVVEIWGRKEFKTADHTTILPKGRRGCVSRRNVEQLEAALEETLMVAPTLVVCCLCRVNKTGA